MIVNGLARTINDGVPHHPSTCFVFEHRLDAQTTAGLPTRCCLGKFCLNTLLRGWGRRKEAFQNKSYHPLAVADRGPPARQVQFTCHSE